MPRSSPVDAFALAYDRSGEGPPVVLLHGWPGDRRDHRLVAALLADTADVVVPDLRGFGESDGHDVRPDEGYSADAQARSVAGLLEELGLGPVVLAGYDIGSRIAQTVAWQHPERVRALVVTPPLPGAGRRLLAPEVVTEFWYQTFHRLDLSGRLLDGDRDAVRTYLEHFWTHWSGPAFSPDPAELDRLADRYGRPGAFTSSIGWYRAGSGTLARGLAEQVPEPAERHRTPTHVLWPSHDPLFPAEWADRLGEFFSDVSVTPLPGCGHFVPVEAPEAFAEAIRAVLATG
ncbi:pimeloyl-ACP methyl ester carboxylesterase [Geodermatophilus tzadiensis]|uniref:Pimeloyl-ACP methyl ester carboxylesterase n=1 Tax=Geodermatophilus tzadiensis TaxID=1137988 RepID=A0A2T0TR51_9ACTN|nr:alpha/beta hydrolase [Geodermatophilus tzadiensis]PRY47988.1 pimeloyl-ACP methyl ester carboxylesterase [Geodermatophilus tzadiensis]